MLILTRQEQQTIMIGDGITVTVLKVRGRQVQLGISAPREIRVDREELYRARKPKTPRVDVT